ncbi:MAG: FAD-dependent monooxygenase [Sphingomonadales bacterium]|jgi:2-polyprenyl-6-methoxyphenol hydroxylase-like FAD-dependent oxidoreductase|nr:FAD-dependent monooxygenase [Sphingomonadales bacterium]
MTHDLIIIGGGIAGGAMATVMARAGRNVLVLEATDSFTDRVRGEWIAPWGVTETRRLGLYDTLRTADTHHLTRHITYDESLPPELAEAAAIDLGMFAPDVPGPLCIRHPEHCQTLFDAAIAAGATMLRPVQILSVELGANPKVRYVHEGVETEATAPLIIGADGRTSIVRKTAGIHLHQDKPHHWFAGLLVDDVKGWDEHTQAIGTENEFGFLAFPQGGERVRVYGGYPLSQTRRFAGADGGRAFLEAFRMKSCPNNDAIANGTPAGPILSFHNNDTWSDEPFVEGGVIVGDAAGWNDPINGLGLSVTYRDVRLVSDILKDTAPGQRPDFRPYAEERAERMRRVRFVGQIQATLDMEFGEEAKARRLRHYTQAAANPEVGAHAAAVLAGPEALPAEFFTEAHRERALGG